MRFYQSSELVALQDKLAIVFQSWVRKWFSPKCDFELKAVKSGVSADISDCQFGFYINVDLIDQAKWFSGVKQESSENTSALYGRLWTLALKDLHKVIHSESPERIAADLQKLQQLGSGVVSVLFLLDQTPITLLLDINDISKFINEPELKRSSEELHAVAPLLGDETVQMQVCTQSLTTTCGQVKSLQVGDKLVLSHKVEKPLIVSVNKKEIVSAFLAKSEGHKALVIEG